MFFNFPLIKFNHSQPLFFFLSQNATWAATCAERKRWICHHQRWNWEDPGRSLDRVSWAEKKIKSPETFFYVCRHVIVVVLLLKIISLSPILSPTPFVEALKIALLLYIVKTIDKKKRSWNEAHLHDSSVRRFFFESTPNLRNIFLSTNNVKLHG